MIKPFSIDEFISGFPPETIARLEKIRQIIRKAAPKATECINYGIPTFQLNGNLVHFSGYKNHIGFYPGSKVIASFKKEISMYKNAKGSVQFPLDKPMPTKLIKEMVIFAVKEHLKKTKK